MRRAIFFTLFSFFSLIVFITVAAGQIIYTPTEVSYRGIWDKDLTQVFVIVSDDYSGRIKVMDFWAEPGITERDLALFTKKASEVGVHINYEKEFYITEGGRYELKVTLRTNKPGLYHGLIAFAPVDSPGIGVSAPSTWVTVDTRGIHLFPVQSPTNQSTLTIKGLSSEKELEILLNGEPAGTITAQNYSFTASISLSEGNNTILVKGSDLKSNPISVVLDTTPPPAPVISAPQSQSTVFTPTCTVSGNAECNSIVRIFVNGEEERESVASSSGEFSCSVTLEKGNNTLIAIAVDGAGNPSAPSEPIYVFYNESVYTHSEDSNKTEAPKSNKTAVITSSNPSASPPVSTPVQAQENETEAGFAVSSNRHLYAFIAVILAIFAGLVYFIFRNRSRGKDVSLWTVSRIHKRDDGTYDAVVTNDDGKKTTIKLNEGLFRKLKKNKELELGRHRIVLSRD